MKKYLEVKPNSGKITHIKLEIYYHLGGMNMFTHRNEERGYYISATPVERTGIYEMVTAFSGIKQCILPCSRKSAKREAEAEKTADFKDILLSVLNRNNLELIEEV